MPYFVNGIREEEVTFAPLSSLCFDFNLIRPGGFDCVVLPALDFWPCWLEACFFFFVVILKEIKNPKTVLKNNLKKPNIIFLRALCGAFCLQR